MAGDGDKRGQHEGREEGRGLPVTLPGLGEQEGEKGHPGLRAGQSQGHHGAGEEVKYCNTAFVFYSGA